MKVLIACEHSGVVRDAFRARGHAAVSCDLLPTEAEGPHYQGDVRDVLLDGWDLLIAHPPCTYLAVSGLHWNGRVAERALKTEAALDFVLELFAAPIPKIALENPVGCINSRIRRPDQIIQPWQFGHPESKQTCLWLKGLPLLVPTNVLTPTRFQPNGRPQWDNMTPSGQNKLGPSPDRWALRSKTYAGIAAAFADQWTDAVLPEKLKQGQLFPMKLGFYRRSRVVVGSLCKLPLDFLGPHDDPVPMLVFGPLFLICLLLCKWTPAPMAVWGLLLFAYGVWRGYSAWWDSQRQHEAEWRLQHQRPGRLDPSPRAVELDEQRWQWQQKRTMQRADEADGKGLLWWEDER